MTQPLRALEMANQIRMQRAVSKQGVRRGDVDPAQVILDPPSYWASAKIEELLKGVPYMGSYRVRTVCAQAMVDPARRLDALSERQRRRLADALHLHQETRAFERVSKARRKAA